MKKICYTAIIGQYDTPQSAPLMEGWDCIAFTDNTPTAKLLKEKGWKVRRVKQQDDNVRHARTIKLCPWYFMKMETGDLTIWMDGNIELLEDLDTLAARLEQGHVLAVMKHPQRDCVYDEVDACIKANKDDALLLSNQARVYSKRGFPRKAGLVESKILVRVIREDLMEFCERWRDELYRHSRRDQVSFPWIMMHHPIAFNTFERKKGEVFMKTIHNS